MAPRRKEGRKKERKAKDKAEGTVCRAQEWSGEKKGEKRGDTGVAIRFLPFGGVQPHWHIGRGEGAQFLMPAKA